MRILVGAALVGTVVAPMAVAQGPSSRAIASCIANNGARYAEPDSAVVSQYLSVAAACRAVLTEDASADVTFTANRRRTAQGTPSASGGSPAPANPSADGARPAAAARPGSVDADPPAPRSGRVPAPGTATGEDVAFVTASLAAADTASGQSVRPAAPWSSLGVNGLGWVVGAGILAGAGLFFLRRMNI